MFILPPSFLFFFFTCIQSLYFSPQLLASNPPFFTALSQAAAPPWRASPAAWRRQWTRATWSRTPSTTSPRPTSSTPSSPRWSRGRHRQSPAPTVLSAAAGTQRKRCCSAQTMNSRAEQVKSGQNLTSVWCQNSWWYSALCSRSPSVYESVVACLFLFPLFCDWSKNAGARLSQGSQVGTRLSCESYFQIMTHSFGTKTEKKLNFFFFFFLLLSFFYA